MFPQTTVPHSWSDPQIKYSEWSCDSPLQLRPSSARCQTEPPPAALSPVHLSVAVLHQLNTCCYLFSIHWGKPLISHRSAAGKILSGHLLFSDLDSREQGSESIQTPFHFEWIDCQSGNMVWGIFKNQKLKSLIDTNIQTLCCGSKLLSGVYFNYPWDVSRTWLQSTKNSQELMGKYIPQV